MPAHDITQADLEGATEMIVVVKICITIPSPFSLHGIANLKIS